MTGYCNKNSRTERQATKYILDACSKNMTLHYNNMCFACIDIYINNNLESLENQIANGRHWCANFLGFYYSYIKNDDDTGQNYYKLSAYWGNTESIVILFTNLYRYIIDDHNEMIQMILTNIDYYQGNVLYRLGKSILTIPILAELYVLTKKRNILMKFCDNCKISEDQISYLIPIVPIETILNGSDVVVKCSI